ncbi:MAG: hypothetical protein M1828_003081 [Chrysothrix sp. TS-e1954]|nr:MAG: hypothetical protein M1828_003081 [Chrysothrix sp. TS-e1954]
MLEAGLPLFQTYLLPALPFRRNGNRRHRNNSDDSTSSTTSTAPQLPLEPPSTSLPTAPTPSTYLTGHTSTISCIRCRAHLALTTQIISKGFTGRHGRAYLVAPAPYSPHLPNSGYPLTMPNAPGSNGMPNRYIAALPNTNTHKPVPRHLVTGMHTVCDVSCSLCGSVVGWKYVGAEEEAQRYKVGKFILETRRTVVECCWENGEGMDEGGGEGEGAVVDDAVWGESTEVGRVGREGETVFDSENEDECEDLFAGIWSQSLARKRRGKRLGPR